MKRRLNWIDYAMILVLIGVVSIVAVKYRTGRDLFVEEELQERRVELEIRGVRDYTVNTLEVGDSVYLSKGGSYFGEIVEVRVEPNTEIMVTDDRQVIEAEIPERYLISLDIVTSMSERDSRYYVEGVTELNVNSVGMYRTDKTQFGGTIKSIEE